MGASTTITVTKSIGGVVGGFVAYWLGGFDAILISLIAMIVIDYISGILAAVYNKTLNSEIGWKGIIKKVFMLLIVAVACIIEKATGNAVAIREIVIMFFIFNEGISIIENAGHLGLPIPKKLVDILEQLENKEGDK